MGWIQKTESKLYSGYLEYGGSYLEVSHTLVVSEGRFFKVDDGYVLLAICARITGFKDPIETETKLAIEIHNKDYERWLGKESGNKKFSPNWYEVAVVGWLDSHPEALEKSFAGNFMFSTSEASQMMLGGDNIGDEVFRRVKWFEPTGKIEFKLGSKNAFGGSKSSGQSEYQKLQDRTNWLYDQYASIASLKREGDANLNMLISLACGVHHVDEDVSVQALTWNLVCQITGNIIPPPKPDVKL